MMEIHPIRTWRIERGLTQRQAADQIPVSRTTWARWESFKRKVDRELVPTVSEKTGIPRRELRPDLAVLMDAAE